MPKPHEILHTTKKPFEQSVPSYDVSEQSTVPLVHSSEHPLKHKGDCKYHPGDKVKFTSGACCYVQYRNEDGTYAMITDDQKHAFNAKETDLELIAIAAEVTNESMAKPKREPKQ